MRVAIMAALAGAIGFAGPAFALDKVTFGTNWLADPEAGGYYQALVDGTYAKYGLDVTILPGRPDVERRHAADRRQNRVLHGRRHDRRFPGGAEQYPDHRRRRPFPEEPANLHVASRRRPRQMAGSAQANPAFVSAGAVNTFWAWMRLAYGFKDENIKPYNFNSAPFIAEPAFDPAGIPDLGAVRGREAGRLQAQRLPARRLRLLHLFDPGRNPARIVEKNPDIVQRFVDASTIGWYHYLYGDNSKANEAIKKENPEMTDEQIAFSIAKMKEYGIVDSGDTLKLGIRRDDRRALERLLQQDGQGRRGQGRASTTRRPTRSSSSTRASASTCDRSDADWRPLARRYFFGAGSAL